MSVNSSAVRKQVVDLSGGNVTFSPATRMITINGGGVLNVQLKGDAAVAVTAALPAGSYAIQAIQINQSGTTATGITAWW